MQCVGFSVSKTLNSFTNQVGLYRLHSSISVGLSKEAGGPADAKLLNISRAGTVVEELTIA
jgi:hypothetical protein